VAVSAGEESEGGPGRGPSRLQRSAAAAAGALVGVKLGPEAAVAGAAAVPYLELLARWAWDGFRPDSQRRQAEMLGVTAEAAAQDPEQLADLIGQSEGTRLLTATAMAGAARTAWPPKVAALGRALAAGLIADDARIDVAELVLPAMADMERPHVSLLELLVRWWPGASAPRQQDQRLPLRRVGEAWEAGRRIWTAVQIGQARPELRPVVTSLIGTLERYGLAVQNDDTAAVLAEFSKQIRKEMARNPPQRARNGAQLLPVMPEMTTNRITPAPSWSPTNLGDQVLGYYQLAATEFDDAQAGTAQPRTAASPGPRSDGK
jgi:hypothetical protein